MNLKKFFKITIKIYISVKYKEYFENIILYQNDNQNQFFILYSNVFTCIISMDIREALVY